MRFSTAAVIAFIAYTSTLTLAAPVNTNALGTQELQTRDPASSRGGGIEKRNTQLQEVTYNPITNWFCRHLHHMFHPEKCINPKNLINVKRDLQEIEARDHRDHRRHRKHRNHRNHRKHSKHLDADADVIPIPNPNPNPNSNLDDGNQGDQPPKKRDLQEIEPRHVSAVEKLFCAWGMHLKVCNLAPVTSGPQHFAGDTGP
jgi:hypothetical protein